MVFIGNEPRAEPLDLFKSNSKRVSYNQHVGAGHQQRADEGRNKSQGGEWDRDDVVEKGPEEILFNCGHRESRESYRRREVV